MDSGGPEVPNWRPPLSIQPKRRCGVPCDSGTSGNEEWMAMAHESRFTKQMSKAIYNDLYIYIIIYIYIDVYNIRQYIPMKHGDLPECHNMPLQC